VGRWLGSCIVSLADVFIDQDFVVVADLWWNGPGIFQQIDAIFVPSYIAAVGKQFGYALAVIHRYVCGCSQIADREVLQDAHRLPDPRNSVRVRAADIGPGKKIIKSLFDRCLVANFRVSIWDG